MMMDQGTERFTHNFVLFKRPEWWKYNWQAQQSGQTIILDQEQQNLWETQENLGWRKRSALFCQKSFFLHFTCILTIFDAHPFCLFPHYPARTLRALGLFLADGAPTVVWGKPFWRVGRFFCYKNGRNSEQKGEKSIPSRPDTVFPRATNRPSTKLGVV